MQKMYRKMQDFNKKFEQQFQEDLAVMMNDVFCFHKYEQFRLHSFVSNKCRYLLYVKQIIICKHKLLNKVYSYIVFLLVN